MLHTAALPFVLHRDSAIVSRHEVTSTQDHIHGLLYLDGEQLVVQWRTRREVSRVGDEIRTDHELTPVREVAVPLAGLAGARVRRVWRRWWFGEALVLTAADLTAFDRLTGEGDLPGLVLEHPAEMVLEVRRSDRNLAREFVSELRLAISEHLLASYETEMQTQRLQYQDLMPPEIQEETEGEAGRTGARRERT